MKIIPIKIAIIHWVDSAYYRIESGVVEELPEMLIPRNLFSSGILLHEDDNSISICQDMETTGAGSRMVLTIPKVSVISKEIFIKKIRVN